MNDQQYSALKGAIESTLPEYSHLLRDDLGALRCLVIQHALTDAYITWKTSTKFTEGDMYGVWVLHVQHVDAERAEWIARRVEEDSQTWEYVQRMAVLMEHKFSLNRHKGDREGWMQMTPDEIFTKLTGELHEATLALWEWKECPCDLHARSLALECADLANYGVELADRVGGL